MRDPEGTPAWRLPATGVWLGMTLAVLLACGCGPWLPPPVQSGDVTPVRDPKVPVGLHPGVKASDGQLIVGLQPGYEVDGLPNFDGQRPEVLGELDMALRLRMVRLPSGVSVDAAIARWQSQPGVALLENNQVLASAPHAAATGLSVAPIPNDPYYTTQWSLAEGITHAREFWGRRVSAQGIMVAVIDTGVNFNHPDLRGRVLAGYNFKDGNDDIMDADGHGTHVAGIIGAAGNNGVGIAGVAWDVRILAIKVMDHDGGTDYGAVAGIKYAADAGAKVINLSFSEDKPTRNPLFDLAVQYATGKGSVVIAAAGNQGKAVSAPGNAPGAITVSATSLRGTETIAGFSNRGPEVALAAPGEDIVSTYTGTGYKVLSGTSMAAPMVAGAAAILLAEHPGWTPDQVKSALTAATDPIGGSGRSDAYGYGRLDLGKLP